MAVKGAGTFLKFSEIAAEFGDSPPYSMSEFIRAGSLVPSADANGNIPTSAAVMRFSHFYGAVNVIAVTASSGANVSAATLFGASWTTDVPKELIIPSGVTLGATSTASSALTVENTLVGSLTIKNSGSIQGAGGDAGSAGGDAIDVNATCTIINESGGVIYGGGGGGGIGGQGSYTSNLGGCNCTCTSGCSSCSSTCSRFRSAGSYCQSDSRTGYPCGGEGNTYYCFVCLKDFISSGGTGGVGQGYLQSATSGAGGGTNAGTGGTGGSFGTVGSSGANGNYSNGASGGAAGNYINGIASVTLTNSGTVAGGTV